MSSDRLPELLVVALEALEAADGELQQLDDPEFEMPWPDEVAQALDLGETLSAVLDRIYQGTTHEGRRKIDQMIVDECDRWPPYFPSVRVPVSAEILREIAEAQETLRRAALTDPEVRAVMDEVLPKGWVW